MTEQLNLTLQEPNSKSPGTSGLIIVLLVLVLAVGIANIVLVKLGPTRSVQSAQTNVLLPSSQEQLALKLEKQGLHLQAAQAWKDYLSLAQIDSQRCAKIWYRIGKLHHQANQYAQALESFYRSESTARIDELSGQIARNVRECLEKLGKFAALRYELADRLDVKKTDAASGELIVAQIGPDKITKAQLDRQIEQQIDMQLSQLASYLLPEQIKEQKQQLFQRLSSSKQRLAILNQLIIQEILYRRARELRLADNSATALLLTQAEKAILAQAVLEKELSEQINITPGDLETYYNAHKEDYVEPPKAQISVIQLQDNDTAAKLLTQLKSGKSFEDLAQTESLDKTTAKNGGKIDTWIEKDSIIAGIGRSPQATAAIFSTQKGQIVDKPIQTDSGFWIIKVHDHQDQRQISFDQVQSQVYQALRSQKEKEVQQSLLQDLRNSYDVVIHHGQFADKTWQDNQTSDKQ